MNKQNLNNVKQHKISMSFLGFILALSCFTATAAEMQEAAFSDPTRPLAYVQSKSEKAQASLNLQAVFFADDNAVAIINGESLRVGDTLLGWKVKQIKSEQVVLQSSSASKTLRLHDAIMK